MATADLTAERLRSILDYTPDDGCFRWREPGPKRIVGAVAGSRQRIGYVVIRVGGTLYYAHRLAWLHVKGQWPSESVDHIDGDKSNNRWRNLRDVPHQKNCQNQHRAQGSSNLLGAVRNSRSHCWRAIITVNGKQRHIGTFSNPEAAHAAYLRAREELK